MLFFFSFYKIGHTTSKFFSVLSISIEDIILYRHHVSKYKLYVYINIMYDMIEGGGANSIHISFKYYILGAYYYILCKNMLQIVLPIFPQKKKLNPLSASSMLIVHVLRYFEGSIILYKLVTAHKMYFRYLLVGGSSRVSSFPTDQRSFVCYT